MKIEQVTTSVQLAHLAMLEKACFDSEAWSIEELSAFLDASIRRAMLLIDDDRPIGYVIITMFDGEAEIERIGIMPAYQGKHIGRAFIEAFLERVNARRCVLEVSADNIAACRAYQACGFGIFSTRHAYYKDGADALMMEWKRTDHE